MKGLDVFAGQSRSAQAGLVGFIALDIIVHALQAPETLEKLVGLVGVVEMRKVFPLDVESLL